MLFKRFTKPMEVLGKSGKAVQVSQRLIEQVEAQPNRNFHYGYLHIPKTGGSGVDDLLSSLAQQGTACPVKLGHGWKFNKAIRRFPKMSVSFVLRDPVERMVSGFWSRMRMGRPRNNSMWSPAEAIAFTYFHHPRDLFLALIGEDERDKSAALFALDAIQHLRFNYRYYFKSVKMLEKKRDRIGIVGNIDRMDDFLIRFAEHAGLDPKSVEENYCRAHVGEPQQPGILDDTELQRVRELLVDEYEIYNYLNSLAVD